MEEEKTGEGKKKEIMRRMIQESMKKTRYDIDERWGSGGVNADERTDGGSSRG